jgi:hypothetical protein
MVENPHKTDLMRQLRVLAASVPLAQSRLAAIAAEFRTALPIQPIRIAPPSW